jgi:hypothetical protein
MQTAKKLKQEEKKVVLAYAQLKLKANRLNKELDSMKEHIDLWNAHQKQIAYCEYKAIGEVSNAQ